VADISPNSSKMMKSNLQREIMENIKYELNTMTLTYEKRRRKNWYLINEIIRRLSLSQS